MRHAWLSVVLLAVSVPALAQEQSPPTPTPQRFEIFAGYQIRRTVGDSEHLDVVGPGQRLVFAIGWNLTPTIAVVAPDIRFGVAANRIDGTRFEYSVLVGPRFYARTHSRFTPFGEVLVGATRGSYQQLVGGPVLRQTFLQVGAGGGLDYEVNRAVSLRLFHVGVRQIVNSPGSGRSVTASAGVTFRFGARVGQDRAPQ